MNKYKVNCTVSEKTKKILDKLANNDFMSTTLLMNIALTLLLYGTGPEYVVEIRTKAAQYRKEIEDYFVASSITQPQE